jgi:putative copper resistance protein D
MTPDAALIVCRFLHDAAAMLVWGGAIYLVTLVPRALADEVTLRLTWAGLLMVAVAVATTAAALPIEAARLGNGWADAFSGDALTGFLFDTGGGSAWMWQAATAIALALALLLPAASRRVAIAVAAGAMLVTLALSGHAVMHDGGAGLAQRLNDAAHVLSAGAWFGALVPLAAIMRRMSAEKSGDEARMALERFSRAGHVAVALAIATGAANTLFIVGKPPSDWSSAYQELLSAKIAVVGAMVALALANRYTLMPRMKADDAAAVAGLRRGTLAEIGLGLTAIALVAVFGTLDPFPG